MSHRKDIRERFDSRWTPEPYSGCWLWTGGRRSTGYGAFKVGYCTEGNRRMESAHRVSWLIFVGEIPKGMCVLHRCDTPLCVNPSHLFLGTLTDNNQDMARKGRLKGRRKFPIVLSENDILSIRNDARSTRTIAPEFGISQSHVSLIKRRKVWKEIV